MTLYADTAGERLDAFLARSLDGLSRSAVQRLTEEGCAICLASLEDIHDLEARLIAALTPEEQIAFADMLVRIAASLH